MKLQKDRESKYRYMDNKKEAFVFFDIDGTLYDPRYGIPDSTRESIDLLKKNGHHPVICTGRTKAMLLPAFLEMNFDGILGGAGAYGEWEGETLFSDGISPDAADELVRNFRAFGFHPYAEGVEHLYFDPVSIQDPLSESKRIFSLWDENILKPYEKDLTDIAKVSAVFTENSDPEGFIGTLQGQYHAVNHFGILLETYRAETSKGHSIQKLMSFLGHDLDQTYAYGDSFNDLSMLETVKYGVCMENGDPKLLEKIPLHAKRLEKDGIYYSLKDFGLI